MERIQRSSIPQYGEKCPIQIVKTTVFLNKCMHCPLLNSAFRLLVNLTQPAVLCFQGVVPEERGLRTQFLEVQTQLIQYKQVMYII